MVGPVPGRGGVVRRAAGDDLEAVLDVDASSPIGRQQAALLILRVETGECLVYDDNGVIKGYTTVRARHFFGRDFLELLAVSPDFRHTGIGRALVRGAVDLALTPMVFSSVDHENGSMRALLEGEGWSVKGSLEGIELGQTTIIYGVLRDAPGLT